MKKIRESEKEEAQKNMVVYEYSAYYVHKEYTVFTMRQPQEEAVDNPLSFYRIDYRFDYNTPIFRPPIA
jgi:hypothetical protein